jgi:transcriptional antiterminator
MNKEWMTVQQLAEKYAVSTKTIRRWIADAELEPDELVIPKTGGHKVPLYSIDQVDANVHLKEVGELKSDTSKLKFMIGHVELEGTNEQRKAIRDYVDAIQHQLDDVRYDLQYEKYKLEQVKSNQRVILRTRLQDKIAKLRRYIGQEAIINRLMAEDDDEL